MKIKLFHNLIYLPFLDNRIDGQIEAVMSKIKIFISSVQNEFGLLRQQVFDFIAKDVLLSAYFEPYLFEASPAEGRSPQKVFLEKVNEASILLLLIGEEYGYEDEEGISPTEREYNEAVRLNKERWVFIEDGTYASRHPKVDLLISKVNYENKRRKFKDFKDLKGEIIEAAIQYLQRNGVLQSAPFDSGIHPSASLADIDEDAVQQFVREARRKRTFPLREGSPSQDILYHLNLMNEEGYLTNSALLAFAKQPQRYIPSASVKCAHLYGVKVKKPLADQKIFTGNIFDLIDATYQWVLSKLANRVEVGKEDTSADITYELPPEAIREAVVNALAHRDYNSPASVQVMLFQDRLEISNPGILTPPLNLKLLKSQHQSYPPNNKLAHVLYLSADIEQLGTGIQEILDQCDAYGLAEPDFDISEGFKITLFRPNVEENSSSIEDVQDKSPYKLQDKLQDKLNVLGKLLLSVDYQYFISILMDQEYLAQDKYRTSTVQALATVVAMKGEMKRSKIQEQLKLRSRGHFIDNYLNPTLEQNLVEMTMPDQPTSPKQRYKLTDKGKTTQTAVLKAYREYMLKEEG